MQASVFAGATMLVRVDDRPASLGDEEDYIPDLIGMDVIIQVRLCFHPTGLSSFPT